MALFFRTLPIGLAVAMPVGAMGVLCMQRTLERGWRSGLATGAGIATADALYASLAALGVGAVTSMLIEWQGPVRVVGGAALVILGFRAVFSASAAVPGRVEYLPDRAGHRTRDNLGAYLSAVALTLANPMTILAFVGVFLGAGLSAAVNAGAVAGAVLGVACGSLLWWLVLVAATTAAGRGMGASARRIIARASGAAVAVFGAVTAVSALLS
jgi:putative LysE/RhtB family amino acid efflux pump